MPKKAVSAWDRMNREFLSALDAEQKRLGDRNIDTAKLRPYSYSKFCRRKHSPGSFDVDDLRAFFERYDLKDYQLCRFIGVEYHGMTPTAEFTFRDLLCLVQQRNLTDYQLCQIMGVEYHGETPT